MPSPIALMWVCFFSFLRFSGVEMGELLINSGNRLLEHPAVGSGGRPAEVGGCARAAELERGAALGGRALPGGQRRLSHALA